MPKKHSREKQAEVLRRTQAKRKEQKKEQVLKAISEIQTQKKPLTFKNIATVAGCSISYLYKWDEIKAYIHELQQQKQTNLNPIEENNKHQPHSLKTLHEVSKQRIHDLSATIKELKHQNEMLRGHVAEIYELRDECQRLRTQLKELVSHSPSSKVVPIQASVRKIVPSNQPETEETVVSIVESIKDMGIKVGNKLKQEINNREPEQVKYSIEAFKQYRDTHHVQSQEACLLSMICEEAEPNTESKPKAKNPQQQITSTPNKSSKKLLSADSLKQLSNLFNGKDD
jgi:prefoldin subunit 5